jgi:hypothetical protein
MKLKLLGALALLMAGSAFAQTRVSVGIGFGGGGYYAPAPAPVVVAPAYPGYGYTWVDPYWYYVGPRRVWHAGYWRAPIRVGPAYGGYYGSYNRGYVGGRYVAPRAYNRGYRR